MQQKLPLIERALELAATGRFSDAQKVRTALKREGYTGVEAHIANTLARQIGELCRVHCRPGDE